MVMQLQTRESRHLLVHGIPEQYPEDRINTFFSAYGRLEKISRISDGILVSFMDVRAAQKAFSSDNRLEGILLKVAFQELGTAKNGMAGPSGGLNLTSPRTTTESKRQSLSPGGIKEAQRSSLNTTKRPLRDHRRECRSPESTSAASSPCTSGLQGFSLEGLPQSRADHLLEESIKQELRHYGRPAYVVIEKNGASLKATVVFNSVSDLEKLLGEKYVFVLGVQCRLRHMEPVELQVYHSNQLAITSAVASAVRENEIPPRYGLRDGMVDVYSTKASRTLYVGNLKHRQNPDHLKAQYEHFGHVLDVDIKNFDSPSPYAFIQFTDIDSVVRAINSAAQDPTQATINRKGRPNFGRSMATNKLWVGAIPAAAPENYVQNKLRALLDGVEIVHYDSMEKQAIVVFQNLEKAQHGYSKIRNGICHLKCDGQETRLSVDFCSENLSSFFTERLNHRNQPLQDSCLSSVLQPPPDPPSDMPAYSHRYDHHRRESRRSPSPGSRRRDRSRTRSRERNRSKDRKRHRRSSRYGDYERGSSRRRDRKDRSASAESTSSSGSSSSDNSRNSSAHSYKKNDKDRRREERRDRERDRRNRSPRPKSPSSGNKWRDRHEDRIPPMLTSLERIDGLSQERAQSGDSGFSEEPRPPLDPPPAPPVMELVQPTPVKEPIQENSPPPNDPPMGPQRLPPQLMSPLGNQRHSLHHQLSGNSDYPSTPKTIHTPGSNHQTPLSHRQGEMVKRSSLDGSGQKQPYPVNPQGIGLPGGPPKTVPCKWAWQLSKNKPIHIANEVIGELLPDPRLCKPYGRMLPKSLPHPTCYHEFMAAIKEHPELRKRSSGSTASGDANRRHSSSSSRMQSFDDPTTPKLMSSQHGPHSAVSRTSSLVTDNEMEMIDADLQFSPHREMEARPSPLDFLSDPAGLRLPSVPINTMRTKIDSIGSRVQAVSTHLEHHSMEVSKSSVVQTNPTTASSPKNSTQSFQERLKQMRERSKKRDLSFTSLKLSTDRSNPPSEPGTATPTGGAELGFAKALAQSASRASLPAPLHINTSPIDTPGSSNGSVKNEISEMSPVSRKVGVLSASYLTKAAPTTPNPRPPNSAVPILTTSSSPSTAPSMKSDTPAAPAPVPVQAQQPSPLLAAPPPPPQLQTPRSDHLRSPPAVPPQNVIKSPLASPSSVSSSGRHFSTSQVPTPIVNAASISPAGPSRSMSMSSVPRPAPVKPTPPAAARHDSMSTIQSPSFETPLKTVTSQPNVSSENKKTPNLPSKDTSKEFLDSLFNSTPSTSTIRRLPKIEKKVTIGPTSSSDKSGEKEKHKKEHKEHKVRRNEDGTLETKEERAKRKEAEKLKKKDKEERKEKKKEKKANKEERKRSKDEDKPSEKKFGKPRKEESGGKKKKKEKKERKRKYESSEESVESENEALLAAVADDESRALIKRIMQEDRTMYDRVKRRSSAATKDDAKQSALDKLNANKKKKKRILLSSSEEEEDGEEQRDSDDGSEKSAATMAKRKLLDEVRKAPKKKSKPSYTSSESEDESDSEKQKTKQPVPNMEDVFGAQSSASEVDESEVKEKKERKKDKHHTDEHFSKSKKKRKSTDSVDMEAIFGSDCNDEKHQKKEKSSKVGRPRKRPMEDHSDDGAKRLKRSSVGSEASVDMAVAARKVRLLSKDSTDTEEMRSERAETVSIPESQKSHPSESKDLAESRPRIMSKGAMKAFESGPSNSIQLSSDDSDVEEVASMDDKGSKDSSSSSSSSEDSDNESQTKTIVPGPTASLPTVPEEAMEVEVEAEPRVPSPMPSPVHEEVVQEECIVQPEMEPVEPETCEEPKPESVQESEPESVPEVLSTDVVAAPEPVIEQEVIEETTVPLEPEHQPEDHPVETTAVLDEEAEKAVESLPVDEHFFDLESENAVLGITEEEAEDNGHIFDDFDEEQERLYPSHDFMHEPKEPGPGDVIEEPAPQDISEDQILAESIIEEPILLEEEIKEASEGPYVECQNEPEDSRDNISNGPMDEQKLDELEEEEVQEDIKPSTPERSATPLLEELEIPVKEATPEPVMEESVKEELIEEEIITEVIMEPTPFVAGPSEPVHEAVHSPSHSECSVRTAEEPRDPSPMKSPKLTSPLRVQPPLVSPVGEEVKLMSPVRTEPPKVPSPVRSKSGTIIQSMPTFEELEEIAEQAEPVLAEPESLAQPEPKAEVVRIQEVQPMVEEVKPAPVSVQIQAPSTAITATQLMTVPTTSCTLPTIAATTLLAEPATITQRPMVEVPATTVIQGPAVASVAPVQVQAPVPAPAPVAVAPQVQQVQPQMVQSPAALATQQLQKMVQKTAPQAPQIFQYPSPAEIQNQKAQQMAQVTAQAVHAQAQAQAQAQAAQQAAAAQAQAQAQRLAEQQAAQVAQIQNLQLLKMFQENPQYQQYYAMAMQNPAVLQQFLPFLQAATSQAQQQQAALLEMAQQNPQWVAQIRQQQHLHQQQQLQQLMRRTVAQPSQASPAMSYASSTSSVNNLGVVDPQRQAQVQQPAIPATIPLQATVPAHVQLQQAQAQSMQARGSPLLAPVRNGTPSAPSTPAVASVAHDEKTPIVWRGMLQVKHSAVNVQLFQIIGSRDFTELCLGKAVQTNTPQEQMPNLKINQRMRIEGNRLRDVFSKLGNGSACLCLASGTSKEETSRNNISLNTDFVEYLNQKGSAGISVFPENRLSYVLPPSEYTDSYLNLYCPVLYQKLKNHPSLGYLFIAFIPSEVASGSDAPTTNGAPAV